MKQFLFFAALLLFIQSCQSNGSPVSPGTSESGNSSQGKAGSMARFGITGDALYALSGEKVKVFDISKSIMPTLASTILLGSGVETIFPYGDKLFFGTQTGMMIYNNADVLAPKYVSRYDHIA